MRALPGLFAVLLSIALAVPGRNDGQASAREVIALARAALGGEASLEAVRSLSASGTFRRPLPFGGAPTSGELDLELLLPDRLKRTETMGLPGRPWFLLVSALDGVDGTGGDRPVPARRNGERVPDRPRGDVAA